MIDSSYSLDVATSNNPLALFTADELSTEEGGYRANSTTIANIMKLVNTSVSHIARQWKLSASEVADLRQDGYVAAIAADTTYDPTKAAWATWIRRRVSGQLKTSIARLRGYGMTGNHGNIYPLSLDSFTPDDHSPDNNDEEASDPLTQISGFTAQSTESEADVASALETLTQCLKASDIQLLKAHYGFDGPSLTVSELAIRIGYSRKHAFTLLQSAQNSARQCLGVQNS